MFYKLYTISGWFAKQELSQVNIVLGCHHLETGRSSKTFLFFLVCFYFGSLFGAFKWAMITIYLFA